jgi:membrane protein involved in colicin uptake
MTFQASNESGAMRQLFVQGIDSSGKSEIERLYGVERVSGMSNEFTFSTFTPSGKISLTKFLKMHGFVISGDPSSGEFVAIKGKERVTFRDKAKTQAEEAVEVDEEIRQNEEARIAEGNTRIEELNALRKMDRMKVLEEAEKRDQLLSDSAIRLSLSDVTVGELQSDLGRIDAEIARVESLLKDHPDLNHRRLRGKKIIEVGGKNQKWKETRSRLESQLELLKQRKAQIEQALVAKTTKKKKGKEQQNIDEGGGTGRERGRRTRERVRTNTEAQDETRRKAEEEAKKKTEEEVKRKAEEEQKAKEEAEKKKTEEEAKRKAEEEQKAREEAEKKKTEEEAKRKAEEEQKVREEAEKKKTEEEAKRKESETSLPLKKGDSVVRINPDGEVETGWTIIAIGGNKVLISRTISGGDVQTRQVPMAKLQGWQVTAKQMGVNTNQSETNVRNNDSVNEDTGWSKEAMAFINNQLKKIFDINLRKKISDVVDSLAKGSKKTIDGIVQAWGAIANRVKKTNKKLHEVIDKKIQERKQKADERARKKEEERKAKEEAKRKAEEEAKKKADEEVKKKAEEEQRKKEALEAAKIKAGDEVYIRRNNGTIEKGWSVIIAMDNGEFRVWNDSIRAGRIVGPGEIWSLNAIDKRTVDTTSRKITVGMEVYVRRSNGTIEKGWSVTQINPDGSYDLWKPGFGTRPGTTLDEIFEIAEIEGSSTFDKETETKEITASTVLDSIQNLEDVYTWLTAHGSTYNGYPVPALINTIKEFSSRNGEISSEGITREGGLREKVIDLVEKRNIERLRQQMDKGKRHINVELSKEPVIDSASAKEVNETTKNWEMATSADKSWGQILGPKESAAFKNSKPLKFEMKFKSGTTIKILFPGKYHGKMEKLKSDIVRMEQWLQARFGEQGIHPRQHLTILLVGAVPGGKGIRGHGGANGIIMDVADLGSQHFFDAYIHERTHSILGSAELHPGNGGVVEGIANFMSFQGVTSLGLGKSQELERSAMVGGINAKILEMVKGGVTFEEAFWKYFETHHDTTNYNLNYEYGQAFTEAFLKHFNGDLGKFLKLYAELNKSQYSDRNAFVPQVLMRAMRASGFSETDIHAVFEKTSGVLMLRSYRGLELMDVLLRTNANDVEAILREQSLEIIFGKETATLKELESLVFEATRYIVANKSYWNSESAGVIISMLNSKLAARQQRVGRHNQTVLGDVLIPR